MLAFLRRLFAGKKRAAEPDLEPGLSKLLAVLSQAGLEPTPTELAEVLWLAARIAPRTPRPDDRIAAALKARVPEEPQPPRKRGTRPPPRKERQDGTPGRAPPRREAQLYPRTSSSGGIAARPLRAPAVQSLPDALALGRALRPLHRKVASRTRWRLDEEATVERLAEQRVVGQPLWQTVRRREEERWFELALVIDTGASMALWPPMIQDLRRLLAYNGAFRTLRTWYLDTDGDRARLRLGSDVRSARPCKPQTLLQPNGRRLILVLSDCISGAWHTGSVNAMLLPWTRVSPLAVVQMLPRRMWSGTALGRGTETRLRGAGPGAPSAQLSPAG